MYELMPNTQDFTQRWLANPAQYCMFSYENQCGQVKHQSGLEPDNYLLFGGIIGGIDQTHTFAK